MAAFIECRKLADQRLHVRSRFRIEELHESPLAQEFVLEGQQIAAREGILRVLAVRFGDDQASEFTEALERITDLDRFHELLMLAVKARRISQFRRAMSSS